MTRLSNRQYPLLKAFVDLPLGKFMSLENAQAFDQRPFRSMLVRGWVSYSPGHGFHASRKGRDAWREFLLTDIARKDPTQPLTAYFDPTAYKLRPRLQAVPQRKAS